jgi:steroid 5-alpha reductase family enzyme
VFSVGYGLSSAAAGAAMLASGAAGAGPVALAAGGGLVAYGLRLAAFLYWRQNAWPEWKERAAKAPEARAKNLLAPVLGCSALYCLMCSPALWLLRAGAGAGGSLPPLALLGVAVQWVGLALEGVADYQKSAHKAAAPDSWCSSGLFSTLRHPNYLGEILHWGGLFVAGLPAALGSGGGLAGAAGRVVPAALGVLGITSLMLRVTPRLDQRQAEKYGDRPGYPEYIASTSMLVPKLY